jgi:hypothetical protein
MRTKNAIDQAIRIAWNVPVSSLFRSKTTGAEQRKIGGRDLEIAAPDLDSYRAFFLGILTNLATSARRSAIIRWSSLELSSSLALQASHQPSSSPSSPRSLSSSRALLLASLSSWRAHSRLFLFSILCSSPVGLEIGVIEVGSTRSPSTKC